MLSRSKIQSIAIENKGFEIFNRPKFQSEAKNLVTFSRLFFTDKVFLFCIPIPHKHSNVNTLYNIIISFLYLLKPDSTFTGLSRSQENCEGEVVEGRVQFLNGWDCSYTFRPWVCQTNTEYIVYCYLKTWDCIPSRSHSG